MADEFDDQLHARLLAFQQAQGLATDGLAGPKTWNQLVAGAYGSTTTDTSAALTGQAVSNEAKPMAAHAGHAQPEPDHRSDAEIAQELEQRTHKTIAELTLELGHGPIPITPRELEARLIENHTLKPRLPDNSKHTVIDAVRERHDYMDGRFVTRGVVGRPDVVDRMKAAGEADERDQLQQNLATLAHGTGGVRVPSKSTPNAGPKAAPKSNPPKSPAANKGPVEFQKVDPKRVGGGKPANDHGGPTEPASGVFRAQPADEHEPHGEVMLDTGTGPRQAPRDRPVAASRRGRGRGPDERADENPAREQRQDERRKDRRKQDERPIQDPVGEPFRETFKTLKEALGGRDVTVTDRVRTDERNQGLIRQGYTETIYTIDSDGNEWTVHYNRRKDLYAGRHRSGEGGYKGK